MCDLYKRIDELCKQRNISGYALCKSIKIQPSVLTDLKMGRQKSLSGNNLLKIAQYFDISVEELLGKEKSPAVENDKGSEFNDVYKQLNDDSRATMLELAKVLLRGQS